MRLRSFAPSLPRKLLSLVIFAGILASATRAAGQQARIPPSICVHPRVLIAGGTGLIDGVFVPLNSAELYDPASASFSPLAATMIQARTGHTATTLSDGCVLLAGGYGADYIVSNTAEIYDPATGKFGATGNMHDARYGHTATLLRDGTVLIVGGHSPTMGEDVARAELYDPRRGIFMLTGHLRIARSGHSATLLDGGGVLITGGYSDELYQILDSAELYHPRTHGFSELCRRMAAPSSQQPAILLKSGRVLMVGGFDPNTCCPPGALNRAETFYSRLRIFRATRNHMQENRSSPSVTLLRDGKVLIAGGYPYEAELDDAEIYDPQGGTFTLTENVMSSERGGHTATLLLDGSVLLAGGEAQGTQAGQIRDEFPVASADLYDPATDSFTAVQRQLTTARFDHTANLVCSP